MSQHQATAPSKVVMESAQAIVSTVEYMKGFWEKSFGKTKNQLLNQGQVMGAQFWISLAVVGN